MAHNLSGTFLSFLVAAKFISALKPGSHLWDKRNTSEISTSISAKKHVPFFLVLALMPISLVLCNQALLHSKLFCKNLPANSHIAELDMRLTQL